MMNHMFAFWVEISHCDKILFSPCWNSSLSCGGFPLFTVLLQTIKRKCKGMWEECVCVALIIASTLIQKLSWRDKGTSVWTLRLSHQWSTIGITQLQGKRQMLCHISNQTIDFIAHTDGRLCCIMRQRMNRESLGVQMDLHREHLLQISSSHNLFFLFLKTQPFLP